MKSIALLGGSGYIGRSLLYEILTSSREMKVFVFSRDIKKMQSIIDDFGLIDNQRYFVCHIKDFSSGRYDYVINATGVGDPSILSKDPLSVFSVTEMVDSLVISYLILNKDVLYLNLSSGAVYGDIFDTPITEGQSTRLSLSFGDAYHCYSSAKIISEIKHRSHSDLWIVDLRVFAFFSRFFEKGSSFFLSELAFSVKKMTTFITDGSDFERDLINGAELYACILCVIDYGKSNNFFDVCSLKPFSKKDLLLDVSKRFEWNYVEEKELLDNKKNFYYSKGGKASSVFGYSSKSTAKDIFFEELQKYMNNKK